MARCGAWTLMILLRQADEPTVLCVAKAFLGIWVWGLLGHEPE